MVETASRNGRSEVEILARSGIRLVLGKDEYWLRPLTMAAAETWETRIRGLIGSALAGIGTVGAGTDALLAIGRSAIEAQLDALYAYDDLGREDGSPSALPDREWLFRHASRSDLADALKKLVQHEFPLLRSAEMIGAWIPTELRETLMKRLLLLVVDSAPAISSNGSSTNTPPTAIPNRRARRSRGKCSTS